MRFSEFSSNVYIAAASGKLKDMYSSRDWFFITDILRDKNRTDGMVQMLERVSGIENFYFKDMADLLQVNKILKDNKIGYWA